MDFDNSAQVDALAKLPPEPPKPPERSAWTVVPRGIASGAGKIGAAIVEGVAAISPSDEELRRNPGRTAFSAEDLGLTARSARDFERTLRPDPITAGTAEQVVYGLVSGFTEVGIGAVVAGPAGAAAALGAGEGATVTDDLQRQGVDNRTARMAGAVTGVVNAASVALPLAGPTLKATAGLYLAGGPGGFMAQQAATSAILERAGYAKIAEQFDPLDPVGLAMSALIPLPFAAYGARRVMKAGKGGADAAAKPEVAPVPETPTVPREAVDAAMVHNLTLQRQAQEALPPVARAAEVMRGPVTDNPNFVAWFGDSKVVDETGKPLVVYHGTADSFDSFDMQRAGTNGENFGRAIFLSNDPTVASGYATDLQKMPGYAEMLQRERDVSEVWRKSAVEDGTSSKRFAQLSAERDAVIAERRAMESRANTFQAPTADANVMPVYASLKNPLVVDGKGGFFFQVHAAAIADARAGGHDGVIIRNVIDSATTETRRAADVVVVFDPTQVKSATGNSGDFNPASASLTDPRPVPPPKPDPAPAALSETIAKAQEELTAFRASGKTLDEFVAGKELPPAVNNLLIGLAETLKNPARARALLDMVGKADAKADPANATADAVEAVRTLTDDQLTNTATDPKPAAPDALMQSVSERVAAVELTNPDMPIGVDDSGNPITVRDELARIRKEAFEGTDTELGAADADLVNVAANCALTNGG